MNLPQDVTPKVYWKQLAIIMAKTPTERFQLGLDHIEYVREVVEASILAEKPNLTSGELACAIFERFYGNEHDENYKRRVKESILCWHKEHMPDQNRM